MYARSEQTLFFVGASAQDLKHAYSVLRINLDKMLPEPWQRGAHEMSAAVRAVKVCSALGYLYRAHSLCTIDRMHPRLRRALIPGDACRSSPHWPEAECEAAPWLPCARDDDCTQEGRVALNEGQAAALRGVGGAVSIVQGPPGTGKSSFILEAFLQRMPPDARMLACTGAPLAARASRMTLERPTRRSSCWWPLTCTSTHASLHWNVVTATNKAIDSLVAKFEKAGVTDILAVGSKDRMGQRTQGFTVSSEEHQAHAMLDAPLQDSSSSLADVAR